MARPNRAQAIEIATRRQTALELRLAGVDLLTIGRKLAADPAVNSDGHGFPMGYCIESYKRGVTPTDEQLYEAAKQDLKIIYRLRTPKLIEAVDDMRDLHTLRYERLLFACWRGALQGDGAMIDRAVRILEAEAKLGGLNAPIRTEVGKVEVPADQTPTAQARQQALASLKILADARAKAVESQRAIEAGPSEDQEQAG